MTKEQEISWIKIGEQIERELKEEEEWINELKKGLRNIGYPLDILSEDQLHNMWLQAKIMNTAVYSEERTVTVK